jgi:hypothetical protein
MGIIEADETFLTESFKGKRNIERKSRKRGGGRVNGHPDKQLSLTTLIQDS